MICLPAFAGKLREAPRLPHCERHLWNESYLSDPLTSGPENPDDPDGFVTDQLPLTVDTFLNVYEKGFYVGGEEGGMAMVYAPKQRGVMWLDPADPDRGISQRDLKLMRSMRAKGFRVKFDNDFEGVIEGCRNKTPLKVIDRQKRMPKVITRTSHNWISPAMKRVFLELRFAPAQHAHSVEVYLHNELVAGLFGTFVNGVFTGESMYFVPGLGDNATKLALYELRHRLAMKGHAFIDTVDVLGLILDWGGEYVSNDEYQRALAKQQALNLPF